MPKPTCSMRCARSGWRCSRHSSTCRLAQQNLALARENAATFDEMVTLNQARVRSGDVAEVELLRSRIAALQSQQAVRGAELKVLSERRRLERVIGRTPGTAPFEIRGARARSHASSSRVPICGLAPFAIGPTCARCSSHALGRRPRSGCSSLKGKSTSRSARSIAGRTASPVAATRSACSSARRCRSSIAIRETSRARRKRTSQADLRRAPARTGDSGRGGCRGRPVHSGRGDAADGGNRHADASARRAEHHGLRVSTR